MFPLDKMFFNLQLYVSRLFCGFTNFPQKEAPCVLVKWDTVYGSFFPAWWPPLLSLSGAKESQEEGGRKLKRLQHVRAVPDPGVQRGWTDGETAHRLISKDDVIPVIGPWYAVCTLQAFTIMDQNRDGFIDKNDLRDTFAALGKPASLSPPAQWRSNYSCVEELNFLCFRGPQPWSWGPPLYLGFPSNQFMLP